MSRRGREVSRPQAPLRACPGASSSFSSLCCVLSPGQGDRASPGTSSADSAGEPPPSSGEPGLEDGWSRPEGPGTAQRQPAWETTLRWRGQCRGPTGSELRALLPQAAQGTTAGGLEPHNTFKSQPTGKNKIASYVLFSQRVKTEKLKSVGIFPRPALPLPFYF